MSATEFVGNLDEREPDPYLPPSKKQRVIKPGLRASLAASLHRWSAMDRAITVALVVSSVLFIGLLIWDASPMPPISALAPFVVAGGLFLQPRRALFFFALIFIGAVLILLRSPWTLEASILPLGAQVVIMSIMFWVSDSRSQLGVLGVQGESMLVDLRDRLRRAGELPELPPGWFADQRVQSARRAKFAGDFVNAVLTPQGQLEIVLVDVSGKGSAAGTRALLLSGAMGGLLGAMPADRFLPAANAYLLRQEWVDGFATCVHLAVDLHTGEYSVGTAGHPPVARRCIRGQQWELIDDALGPALGVIPDAVYPRRVGTMQPGDVLLAYSDGVVEARGQSLNAGIERMLQVVDHVRNEGDLSAVGDALCATALAGEEDDRAAVIIERR